MSEYTDAGDGQEAENLFGVVLNMFIFTVG